MLRHSLLRSTFVLLDAETKKKVGQFRSAHKVFEYLGNCIHSSGREYRNYGAFVKLLGQFDWEKRQYLSLTTCKKSMTYQLEFHKELKMI